MRPCFFYTFLSEKLKCGIQCQCHWRKLEGVPRTYYDCEHFGFCQKNYDDSQSKTMRMSNTIVNTNKDGMELICYEKAFPVITKRKNVERKRVLNKFLDGYAFSSHIPNPWERLERNRLCSAKRAQELVYSYINNNEWKYFITLTFSPHVIDRSNSDLVKYEYKKFRRKLQYWDNDIRLLCIPEEHAKNGELHFHILMGTEKDFSIVDVQEGDTWDTKGFYNAMPEFKSNLFLFPIFERGVWKKGKYGNPMFALSSFNKGRNFTSIIDPTRKHAAYNYVAKYVNKTLSTGHGKKRIYATGNLDKKTKINFMSDHDNDVEMIFENNLSIYKISSKYTIFRNFNATKQIIED